MRLKSALFAPLLILAVFVITGLSGGLLGVVDNLSDNLYLSVAILNILAFLLPLAFYSRVRGLRPSEAVHFGHIRSGDLSFVVITSVTTVAGLAILRYLAFFISNDFSEATAAMPSISGSGEALIVLSLAIIPAFLEEVLFRGVLFFEYRRYGPVMTVAFTSVCFAMLHFSFSSFIFYLFGGIMLGILTVVCDSTIPAIILHIICNIVSLYFQESFLNYINQSGNNFLLLYVLIAVFLICLYLFAGQVDGYYKRKATEKSGYERRRELMEASMRAADKHSKKHIQREGAGAKMSEVFLSPSFLTVSAFFILKATGTI